MKHLVFSHVRLKSDTLSFFLSVPFLLKSFQLMPGTGSREQGHPRGKRMILGATKEDEPASCYETMHNVGLCRPVPTRWTLSPWLPRELDASFLEQGFWSPCPPLTCNAPPCPESLPALAPHIPPLLSSSEGRGTIQHAQASPQVTVISGGNKLYTVEEKYRTLSFLVAIHIGVLLGLFRPLWKLFCFFPPPPQMFFLGSESAAWF